MKYSNIVGMDGQPLAVAYEGATQAPRGSGWLAPSSGPNRALAASGAVLRNRSRAAHRNSCLLRSAIEKGVTAEVGKGVTIMSIATDDEVRGTLNALWKESVNQLDPWGDQAFGGILQQAVRARRTSGEVFIKRVPVRLGMGLKVPLQIEVLEADFCPLNLNKRLDNGNRIRQGIEFKGRRKVAFWFFKGHPGEGGDATDDTMGMVRVPARDVIHHYKATRPGQLRGEPETAAALLKDKTFSDYSDAELRRKETRAGFTGFLYREGYEEDDFEYDPATGKSLYDDGQGPAQQTETVSGGTILRGVAGEKLQLFEGDQGGGYAEFVKWQAQQLAAALEIPYPLLTGDWAGLSDRTIRAILNEYRRGVTSDQMNLLGFQICLKVWQWFVDTCVMVGLVGGKGFAENPWAFYNLDIRPDAHRHLHPEQDIRSRSMAINNLFSNPEKEAAECGTDLDENMRATARTLKKWKAALIAEGLDPDKVGIYSAQSKTDDKEEDDE